MVRAGIDKTARKRARESGRGVRTPLIRGGSLIKIPVDAMLGRKPRGRNSFLSRKSYIDPVRA